MHTQLAAELLMRLPLMAGLTESQSLALAVAAEKRFFKNGELLIEAGKFTDHLFVILSGRVNSMLNANDDKGYKNFLVASFGIGECVGEIAALDHKPHCHSVVADGPVQALMLNHTAFCSVLQNNARVAAYLLKAMFSRIRQTDRQIMWLTAFSVQGRIARTLMDIAIPRDDGQLHIKCKVSNVTLAKKVGASREMVALALKDLETKGFIEKMPMGGLRVIDKRKRPRP
jgi:CRP/FNR family cyclic AMP-dependent transcriptional regulator